MKVVAVEPAESSVISGNPPGPHGIHGIGAGIIPQNFDRSMVDEVFQVPTAKALETSREVALKEGLLVGISSGAAIYTALQVRTIAFLLSIIVLLLIVCACVRCRWHQDPRIRIRIS